MTFQWQLRVEVENMIRSQTIFFPFFFLEQTDSINFPALFPLSLNFWAVVALPSVRFLGKGYLNSLD